MDLGLKLSPLQLQWGKKSSILNRLRKKNQVNNKMEMIIQGIGFFMWKKHLEVI